MTRSGVMLTKGQVNTKALVEKRLGYLIPEHLIAPFFAKTDRGIEPKQQDAEFAAVMFAFKGIAIDYAEWIAGFREGTLFLRDFLNEDSPTRQLAMKAYQEAIL